MLCCFISFGLQNDDVMNYSVNALIGEKITKSFILQTILIDLLL